VETRRLGRTNLTVSAIGLGTEYLVDVGRQTVVSVVREAVERGVNYFDVVYAFRHYRDNLGAAFEGVRERTLIAGHLGPAETDGQYRLTRDIDECEEVFDDLLRRLRTDYVDVLFVQNVDQERDFEQIMGPGGLLGLAQRFRREGKTRFIGLSGHEVPVASKAVASGEIDVLMHPVNMSGDAAPGRKGLFHACKAQGVGLVGMKPFAGGELLRQKSRHPITPVQCLSYALSQPGISALVPGVKDVHELRAVLRYLDATVEERGFSAALAAVTGTEEGTCVYCDHCLPCPAGINVGEALRLLATAQELGRRAASAQYYALPVKASECTECGLCVERCPFKVDVISKLREAVELLE